MPQKSVEDGSPPFGIGTFEIFQACGSLPSTILKLNSLVMDGATLEAVALSIRAEILSGPVALEGSSLASISDTLYIKDLGCIDRTQMEIQFGLQALGEKKRKC